MFSYSALHPYVACYWFITDPGTSLRKVKWADMYRISTARRPPSFLLSQPLALWMLPLAIYVPWMTEPHNVPLLSPPFIRPRNEQYTFYENVYFWVFQIFFECFVAIPGISECCDLSGVTEASGKWSWTLMCDDVQWGLRAHLSVFA